MLLLELYARNKNITVTQHRQSHRIILITISPLILLPFIYLNNTNLWLQFLKFNTSKWFRQYIWNLILCANKFNANVTIFNIISNKMILGIYVLTTLV